MSEYFRLRITYAKQGRLRWLSHLELARTMERLVRRSGLPYATTQGFSPHMRFAPGPALPVGTAGLRELFDVWLTAYVPPAEAVALLRLAAGTTLEVVDAEYVATKAKGLQATHTLNRYEFELVAPSLDAAAVQSAFDKLMVSGVVEVVLKGKPKAFNLQECVIDPPRLITPGQGSTQPEAPHRLSCTLLNSEQGSLRPEYLATAALGENAKTTTVTRISLEEPK